MLLKLPDNEILLSIIKISLSKEKYEMFRYINKELRILIDTSLSLSITHNFCEDCGVYSVLSKKDACGSCHVENQQCCYKYTCDRGCIFKCPHCNKLILSDLPFDGWHRVIKCECANLIRFPNFTWWGSHPKIQCDRHCGFGCFDKDYELYKQSLIKLDDKCKQIKF